MSELLDWLSAKDSTVKRAPKRARGGSWREIVCTTDLGELTGKLFVPGRFAEGKPLLLLLHGCGQTAEEFAFATRMTEHADAAGFLVLCAAQCPSRNPNRCWNWFSPDHQQRNAGEPALLVGAVREIASTYGTDPRRVYAAGLSAGGAMAAVLGHTYPDVFAAIGVHSGVAYRSAVGAVAAIDAMRRGPVEPATISVARGVPTIAFHGDADDTVHPGNGRRIITDLVGSASSGYRPGVRRFEADVGVHTRTMFTDAQGDLCAEYWEIRGGPHAWSGGEPDGTFTHPEGPDASHEMLRFFASHRLRPRIASAVVRDT